MNQTGAMLAMPDGWILDDRGRARLERQLARAEAEVTAVAAERCELPPGASHLVVSERRARSPESEVHPLDDRWVRGAAVVRPDVTVAVGEDIVEVGRGRLLVDPGATVHDPWRAVGELEDASPLGRPLTDRPVALFLGFERDPYLADWVRALVNGLVRRGIEGRIAVPAPTGGLHLTRPCAPTEPSVRTLEPEVIVALDDRAAELVPSWLGRSRAGLVRLTQDTTAEITVDRMRLGSRRRRVQARIGRGVSAASMVDLVRALAPHQVPSVRS